MYRIGILLLGMTSLVASGVLVDRNRFGIYPYQGVNAVQGLGLDRHNTFSRDELLRQKFLLDILEQINLPLENQELLQLENEVAINENLFIQPLDDDMLFVLDLIRKNRMLGKNSPCRISNDLHLRQIVGLYKLFLNARDFQTFQRLVIFGRRTVNAEVFVNSLILALGERSDTNMLIIPALYEILPQLYHDPDLVEEIRNIDERNLLTQRAGSSSLRPNLLDVITLGRQNRLLNSRLPETRGMLNILNRSELWMPWRRLHQQLAWRKDLGARSLQQDERNLEKIVISMPARGIQDKPLGLFTEDLGLKSYLNVLINELIVKQGSNRKIERDQLQYLNSERDILEDNRNLNSRDEYTTDFMDRDLQSQRSEGIDNFPKTDSLLYAGRRLRNKYHLNDEDINTERPQEVAREMYTTETRDDRIGESNSDSIPYAGRRLRNRFPILNTERRITTNPNENLTQDREILSEREDDTVGSNNNRLLFVGRRRKNLSGFGKSTELDIGNISEDDTISGGRHVSRDDQRDRNSRKDERKDKYDDDYLYSNRRQNPLFTDDRSNDQDQKQQRGLYARRNEDDMLRSNPDYRLYEQQQESQTFNKRYGNKDYMDRSLYYRSKYGKDVLERGNGLGRITLIGQGPNAFLDTIYRDSQDDEQQSNYLRNDNDIFQTSDVRTELPTTTVNDERLLHINRRRLNELLEGRRVGYFGDDEYQRKNSLFGRSRLNNEEEGDRKYVARDDDTIRRYATDEEEGDRKYVDRDADTIKRDNLYDRRENNDDEEVKRYVKREDNGDARRRYATNEEEGDRKYVDRYGDRIRGGRRGQNAEEGDRKYVDRDDDRIRGGRRGQNAEEGDRRYVDRDDDSIRGGRRGQNAEEGDIRYVDRDDDSIRGGRRGQNAEEGNRRYVDRDDDSVRGGRRGLNAGEGDRRYVDRDDDSVRGGIRFNRRGLNAEEGDRRYVDRDDDNARRGTTYNRPSGQDRLSISNMNEQSDQSFRRYRRSLGNTKSINGRLLIHTLQQMAARINIQRISLGQTQKLEDLFQQDNDRRLINDVSSRSSLNHLNNRQDLLILGKINDISQRFEVILQEEIPRLSALTNEEQIDEVGLLLVEHIQDLGAMNILSDILQLKHRNQEGQFSNLLEHPLHQLMLCRIVDILDAHFKKLQQDRDISFNGVTINNIKVDRLQTYVEYSDVDLTNLLTTNIDQSDTTNKKLVVGRIPRLNHKSFDVKLDIDSDLRQEVVIRTFLGPKTDAQGNTLSLIEQRKNYILLDINTITLKGGRNLITLKSNDISWTSRDTTPCSEIYERVMRALDEDLVLSKNSLIGQSNLFPHRLLIPRGRTNGLPMQLLTVITPIEQGTYVNRNLIGLDSLLADRLPLNYPLDSDIQDLNSFLTVPNIFLKDVTIYHDDNIRLSRLL